MSTTNNSNQLPQSKHQFLWEVIIAALPNLLSAIFADTKDRAIIPTIISTTFFSLVYEIVRFVVMLFKKRARAIRGACFFLLAVVSVIFIIILSVCEATHNLREKNVCIVFKSRTMTNIFLTFLVIKYTLDFSYRQKEVVEEDESINRSVQKRILNFIMPRLERTQEDAPQPQLQLPEPIGPPTPPVDGELFEIQPQLMPFEMRRAYSMG